MTNGGLPDEVVRKRVCGACGHVWFTVEMAVPEHAIGWQKKPVLRMQLTLQPSFIEPADVMENLAKANEVRWKKWAVENGEYS